MDREIRVIKPIELSETQKQLSLADEILINDALTRLSPSLRIINDRNLAVLYYSRLEAMVTPFRKKWGLGNK